LDNAPIQTLNFFFFRWHFIKNYVIKTEMKKVTVILRHSFSVDGSCIQVYRIVGVASAAGGGFAKAPGSVIPVDWSIIFTRFNEKIRG